MFTIFLNQFLHDLITVDFRAGYDALIMAYLLNRVLSYQTLCFIALRTICQIHPEDFPDPTGPLQKRYLLGFA
jgi:hypothetical protein